MWLRPDALVPVEILILKHCAALVAVFVLLPVLTLVQQMVVQGLDLNDLLTLPAGREHGALLPVVDVDRLLVEHLIVASAKVARFFINGRALILKILLVLHRRLLVEVLGLLGLLLGCRLIASSAALWLCRARRGASFSSTWVDIGRDDRFSLLLLGLLWHNKSAISSRFCQHLLDLVDLSLTKAAELCPDFVTEIPVQLHDALLGGLAYVLERMDQAKSAEIEALVELLLRNVSDFGQDSRQRLVLADDQFIRVHCLLGSDSLSLACLSRDLPRYLVDYGAHAKGSIVTHR